MNFRSDINPKNIPKSFKRWFKENKFKLVWNKQIQGYDSNTNIYLHNLGLSIISIQFNIVKGDFYCNYNKLTSLKGYPKEIGRDFICSKFSL